MLTESTLLYACTCACVLCLLISSSSLVVQLFSLYCDQTVMTDTLLSCSVLIKYCVVFGLQSIQRLFILQVLNRADLTKKNRNVASHPPPLHSTGAAADGQLNTEMHMDSACIQTNLLS